MRRACFARVLIVQYFTGEKSFCLKQGGCSYYFTKSDFISWSTRLPLNAEDSQNSFSHCSWFNSIYNSRDGDHVTELDFGDVIAGNAGANAFSEIAGWKVGSGNNRFRLASCGYAPLGRAMKVQNFISEAIRQGDGEPKSLASAAVEHVATAFR